MRPKRLSMFQILVINVGSTSVKLALFEDEFESVTDSSYVTIGPGLERKWWFRYWKPAASLNDLTVYEAIFASEDT